MRLALLGVLLSSTVFAQSPYQKTQGKTTVTITELRPLAEGPVLSLLLVCSEDPTSRFILTMTTFKSGNEKLFRIDAVDAGPFFPQATMRCGTAILPISPEVITAVSVAITSVQFPVSH